MNPLMGLVTFAVILLFSLSPGSMPEVFAKSPPLPYVSSKMETPQFWIDKVRNPNRLLLRADQIQKMNDAILKRTDLYLCRVRDLKEEWAREELLDLLKEDWQGFGETSEVRFGRDGRPLDPSYWRDLKRNINADEIRERNRISFGLIVKRTDIRVFPTDQPSLSSPANSEFDRFQHSMISPGSLVGIYHSSNDRHWIYLQCGFIRGWVRRDAVAIATDRNAPLQFEEARERLLITGSFVSVFSDPSLKQEAFVAQMGSSFPLIRYPQGNGPGGTNYTIRIPFREKDGLLAIHNGYIPKGGDVHPGFLDYTQANVAKQAFKMLHQPYGWGELSGGRDCSRFIMDVFSSFGIVMPRNSKLQAQVGIDLGQVDGTTLREQEGILDRAVPLATTLRLPGHIMLYLGKHKKRHYVIHSIWATQKEGRSGRVLERIDGGVVSDLSLGETGPNGSLLERLIDIRFIGGEEDLEKVRKSP